MVGLTSSPRILFSLVWGREKNPEQSTHFILKGRPAGNRFYEYLGNKNATYQEYPIEIGTNNGACITGDNLRAVSLAIFNWSPDSAILRTALLVANFEDGRRYVSAELAKGPPEEGSSIRILQVNTCPPCGGCGES